MKDITLLKFLTNSKIGSRRFCFDLIVDGNIKVNDKIIYQPMFKIRPENKIYYDNKQVKFNKVFFEPVYIMLYKPREFICSVTSERDKPSILNLIKHRDLKKKHLFPVGRLDYLTEGLIFITNDGYFANYLLQDRNKVPKHYYVEIKRQITEKHIEKIQKGIYTIEAVYRVQDVKLLSANKKVSKLFLVLVEGKNREIRNIFAYLKYKIKILKRFRIGPFKLDPKLKPGEYKLISKREIYKLLKITD